ncbi:MAG: very short patch repair endonuclease [SAR202 cluster bacterium]|nr:very short patch repair endonuclease [SAR202 cluster bacterium]
MTLRKALRQAGIPGYRLHRKGVPGSPDICFPDIKLATFVYGCFWHRCVVCSLPMPKSNTGFWQTKFQNNQERDQRKTTELLEAGWQVIACWEYEIKADAAACVIRIASARAQLLKS